jgi:transposase
MLVLLLQQIRQAQLRVQQTEQALEAWAKPLEACKRLMSIPGVGTISATALVLKTNDPKRFRCGRHLAVWLGLVLKQSSSGDRQVLGGISKRSDGYVRMLLIHGARSLTTWRRKSWARLARLLMRQPTNVAAAAIDNKTARTAWAILARGREFQPIRRAVAA